VDGAERQRHRLVVGGRERDRERELGLLTLLAWALVTSLTLLPASPTIPGWL
jgi:hypothetical protein